MTRHQFVDPPQTWTACVAGHTRDPERQRAATHALLCEGHYRNLEQLLAETSSAVDELERALVRSSSAGPKVTGDPERALPFDEKVSDVLHAAHALLASWTLLVLEEHPDRLHAPRDTTRDMSLFLLRHLDWCAGQDWIGDLLTEIRDMRAAMRSALTTSRTRRVELGPCDAAVSCELTSHAEQPCTGTLTAFVHTDDDGLPTVIGCPECGTAHAPDTWRPLARRLRGGAESWLTYAQLSQLLVVPIGSLKRWASEKDWRRLEGRPTRFHLDDAQASFDEHRGPDEGMMSA